MINTPKNTAHISTIQCTVYIGFSPSVIFLATNFKVSSRSTTGIENFITVIHSSKVKGHTWNTAWIKERENEKEKKKKTYKFSLIGIFCFQFSILDRCVHKSYSGEKRKKEEKKVKKNKRHLRKVLRRRE